MQITPSNPGFAPAVPAAAAELGFLVTLSDASGEFGVMAAVE
jgi:hypothetical protein